MEGGASLNDEVVVDLLVDPALCVWHQLERDGV